jgi:hypothetical protein
LSHQSINQKNNKPAIQNAAGDAETIELVHSGEDYFFRQCSNPTD